MGSFYQYLVEQDHRNDLVGDLAKDVKADGDRIHGNSSPEKWRSHLGAMMASGGARETLNLVIAEYEAVGGWTKKDAMARFRANKLTQKIVRQERNVAQIIEKAKVQRIEPGYHRIRTYIDLRNEVELYVGWFAQNKALATTEAYDVIVSSIVDLLPPDHIDLYRDGAPEHLDIVIYE